MVESAASRVFISYSRKDTAFVDRLEQSLISRGFAPWVDRRKIEGGEDFTDTIQRAIDRCDKVVVVLTPDAAESEWVRIEYRYGRTMHKPVIPILVKSCDRVPIDLNHIQWARSFIADYEAGLNDLLVALARETPPEPMAAPAAGVAGAAPTPQAGESLAAAQPAAPKPPMPPRELYVAGTNAYEAKDLDLAAIYWQRLLDADPNYLDGYVRETMDTIRPRLVEIRTARLRDRAYALHQQGAWDEEITTWRSLLAMSASDPDAAEEIKNAEQNKKYDEMYAIVDEFAKQGNLVNARSQMLALWSRAPYYGDPTGIARSLGLTVAPTYSAQTNAKRKQDEADARRRSADDEASARQRETARY